MIRYEAMQMISAHSLAPDVNCWLANSRHPRVLHVFDHACNLVNEYREVLSVVTPQIGNGPFNLVIEDAVCFSDHLSLQSPITFSADQLTLGDLTINTSNARLWNPQPEWKKLHAKRDNIIKLLITNYQECGLDTSLAKNAWDYSTTTSLQSLISTLSSSLANQDVSTAKNVASKIAGLGIGLTPAGDDLLLGAIYAAWIIHPAQIARVLVEEIAAIAAPLTTSLSAAWLRAGARGEAGETWHDFFNALLIANSDTIQIQVVRLCSIGHTSGADALAGFMGSFMRAK